MLQGLLGGYAAAGVGGEELREEVYALVGKTFGAFGDQLAEFVACEAFPSHVICFLVLFELWP